MKKTLLVLMALLAAVGTALAQPRTVTGVVTSAEDGSTLPQLAVQLKGTTTGVATDLDGNYRIQVPGPDAVLVFTYVGMKTLEVVVGDRSKIDVVMQPALEEIDQVVVTAFGSQKKSSLTGAISSVDEKKLERLPSSDATKAMEGQLAGVTISAPSGTPGSAVSIRIRGIGSINASSAPLIILDGAPYDGSLNSINPADIASYNVLKDAASAALYGARGANGVILITTKQGRAGQTVVNYDGRIGYNYRGVPDYDLITDPGEFYQLSWQGLRNQFLSQEDFKRAGITPANAGKLAARFLIEGHAGLGVEGLGGYPIYKGVGFSDVLLEDGSLNPAIEGYAFEDGWNDWYNRIFEPRMRHEHNLSVSKGMDKTNMFFSLSYLDDQGYSVNSYFKRITTRVNLSQQIYSWLDFSNKFQFVHSDRNVNTSGSYLANPFGYTRNMPPIYPVFAYNLDGTPQLDQLGNRVYDEGLPQEDPETNQKISLKRAYAAGGNLVASQVKDKRTMRSWILNNVATLAAHLPWNIDVSTNVSYAGEFYNYMYRQAKIGDAKPFGGRLRVEPSMQHGINTTQIVDWHWNFLSRDELTLALKLGHEAYFMKNELISTSRSGLLTEETTALRDAKKHEGTTGYASTYHLEGYFGQALVDYLSRYALSLSYRRDGSSVFHPEHRWGSFWSVGGSWRISSEPFFAPARQYVDNLKLRVSYGLQGNDYLLTPDRTARNFQPYQDLYSMSNDGELILTPALKGRKDITWEKNYNLSTALEFGLWRNLVSGEVEFFNRETKDMLFALPIPAARGFTTEPVNVGDMRNMGVEVSLNVNPVRMENVNLTINMNATHYQNKVTKLPDLYKETGIRRGSQLLKEGYSVYEWNMVEWKGVNPENGYPLYRLMDPATGEWGTYERQSEDGSDRNSWWGDSRTWVGSSLPDLTGGFGLQLDAYGVDLSAQFSYGLGGKIYDGAYEDLMSSTGSGSNWHQDIRKSWTAEKPNSEYPVLEREAQYSLPSDRFLIDGSFLAFRSAVLGYTLPVRYTSKALLQQVRLYAMCDGVWLWSNRKGLDPRQFISGVGDNSYSAIRTISLGLQLKF